MLAKGEVNGIVDGVCNGIDAQSVCHIWMYGVKINRSTSAAVYDISWDFMDFKARMPSSLRQRNAAPKETSVRFPVGWRFIDFL